MGPFGSNIKTSNFVPHGVPVIRGGNLTNGFVDDRFVFLTEEKADQLRNSNARPGNIVITHRGTLGQVGLIPSDSRYHHLFQTVFEASEFPDDTPLSQFYALPNSSRRLLEAVLAFKQPERTGELHQQLQGIHFDEAKKARIIRFTNTYSHHGLIAEPSHDMSILHESPQILRDVLALIQHLDPEHFENMMALCRSAGHEDHAATEGASL